VDDQYQQWVTTFWISLSLRPNFALRPN